MRKNVEQQSTELCFSYVAANLSIREEERYD